MATRWPAIAPTSASPSWMISLTSSTVAPPTPASFCSADRAGSGDQGQVEGGDPAGREAVDGGNSVESAKACRQAASRGRVPAAAVRESERRILGDRRGALDLDAVGVVLRAAGPIGRGVGADTIHVLELDARLAVVDA